MALELLKQINRAILLGLTADESNFVAAYINSNPQWPTQLRFEQRGKFVDVYEKDQLSEHDVIKSGTYLIVAGTNNFIERVRLNEVMGVSQCNPQPADQLLIDTLHRMQPEGCCDLAGIINAAEQGALYIMHNFGMSVSHHPFMLTMKPGIAHMIACYRGEHVLQPVEIPINTASYDITDMLWDSLDPARRVCAAVFVKDVFHPEQNDTIIRNG
jgi:hypothetical protein